MIKIITEKIDPTQLNDLCQEYFKTFVKIVVDIEKQIMAVGGELHADAEALLIEHGSKQSNLWGANFYPFKTTGDRLEYTALINIRPSDDNPSMEILSESIRGKVHDLSQRLLLMPTESIPLGPITDV